MGWMEEGVGKRFGGVVVRKVKELGVEGDGGVLLVMLS